MEALFGGAALGAVAGELLKAVINAKENASNFHQMFERLQSTLRSITLRLDEISLLENNLDIKQDSMEELNLLVKNGKSLVQKCSQISCFNVINKLRYRNKLSELDDSLKNYLTTLLPLDHFKNDFEMHKLVKELHMNFLGESSSKHREDSVYQKKRGRKLFLLKSYPHDLDMEDLENSELLNKGTYVTSYKCRTRYGDVLMKSINLEANVREIEFLQRMEDIGKIGQHPNIMLPFGYFSSEVSKFLLYDYVPSSSLYALLREPTSLGTKANWDRRIKIVLGAARGISHIHSEGGVVHGNIKSSNVLLTRDRNGCISDFGLAPMMNIPAATPELGDPELKETREATQKSDVYNFGIMLSEITNLSNGHLLWHPNVLLEHLKIKRLAQKCKHRDPDRRPKMDEVVREIQNILQLPSDNKILPNS